MNIYVQHPAKGHHSDVTLCLKSLATRLIVQQCALSNKENQSFANLFM